VKGVRRSLVLLPREATACRTSARKPLGKVTHAVARHHRFRQGR